MELVNIIILVVGVFFAVGGAYVIYRTYRGAVERDEKRKEAQQTSRRRRGYAIDDEDIEMIAGLPLRYPPTAYVTTGHRHGFGERFNKRPADLYIPARG